MAKSYYSSKIAAKNARENAINDTTEKITLNKAIKNIDSARAGQIAFFDVNGINNTIDSLFESKYINVFTGKRSKANSLFKDDNIVGSKFFGNINKPGASLFSQLLEISRRSETVKFQKGEGLMNRAIYLDGEINHNYTTQKGMQDFQEFRKAVDKFADIKKNGGYIIDFDIESLGGINAFGHQQMDHITEIAAVVKKLSPDGKVTTVETIHSLLGFDDKDYKDVKKYIESLRGKSAKELTGKDNVYLSRLSRMSDSNIELKYSKGFEVTIGDTSKALTDKELAVNVDNALKGLEVQRQIGIHQENYLKSIGITDKDALKNYNKNYVKKVQDLTAYGKGANGVQYNPDRTIVTGHNIIPFDGPGMRAYTGYDPTDPTILVLDTHVRTRWQEELLGQGHHLRKIDINKIDSATKEHGTGTQDFFRAITGKGDGQAHNALIDSNNHYELLMDDVLFGDTLIEDTLSMERKMNNLKSGYKQQGRPGVFYVGSTDQLGWGNKNNALSFVYNPLDESYKTYDGFKVDGKGNVSKEDLKAFGPKANALYEHKVFELDMTGDWKKQFEGLGLSKDSLDEFYQQYKNLDKMWMVASKEYMDKDALSSYGVNNVFEYGGGKTYFQLLTDKQQVASSLGAKIAYKNKDNSLSFIDSTVDALDFKLMEETPDGNIKVKSLKGKEAADHILERSNYRTRIDSAARSVREGSYSKLAQQRFFNLNNNQKVSAVIAENISKNKDLTMDLTSSLIDELGWSDFSGNKKIIPERLTKATVLDKYMENMDPFFKVMDEELAKAFGVNDIQELFKMSTSSNGFKVANKISGQSDMYSKMDFMFRQTLTNVLEEVGGTGLAPGRPVAMTGRELNRLDFNRYELFPEQANKRIKAGVLNASEDIISLDFNKNDALIKMFSNGKFDGMDVIPNSNAAYDALMEAHDVFSKMEGFEDVFKGLSKSRIDKNYRDGNLSIIQDRMMHRIKKRTNEIRETDSGFGYKFARTMQDPTMAIEQLQGMGVDELRDIISRNIVNPQNYMSSQTASSSTDIINNIVDNYFMTFTEADLNNQLSGLNKKQQDIIKSQYKLARQESFARAEELLKATSYTDLDVMMFGKGKDSKMFLGRGSDIRELNFHKYTLQDGVIEYALGNNNYSANFAYNTSEMLKNGWATGKKGLHNIKVTNNVQNAIDQTRSLDRVVDFAKKGGRDVLDDLIYNINGKRAGMLREISPRREALNYANMFQRSMQVDFNGLIGILPELKDEGILDEIIKIKGDAISDDYKKQFYDVVENMRGRTSRPKGIHEMFAYESNLYFQLFDDNITELINDHINFGDNEELKDLFKGVTNYTKNTTLQKGQKTLYNKSAPHGAAGFDKARPPIYQFGNAEMYRRDELEKAVKDGAKEHKIFNHIDVNGAITTEAAEKYMYGKDYTAGVTLKYLNVSSNDLRSAIATNENKDKSLAGAVNGLEGNEETMKKKLLDKAKGLSTYEQQSLVNSRVFDTSFHKTNKQVIAKKKQLMINHAKTIEYIESLKGNINDLFPTITDDGRVIYSKGIEVKLGDRLGIFGDSEETIRAKWDGIYRSRYYNNGRLMNEKDLENAIKQSGVNIKDSKAVSEFLENNYDRRHEVIRKYQTYGAKIFNATSEKSTAESLAMGVGSLDKGISKFLKENGKENLIGNVLTKEYEDMILDEIGNIDIRSGMKFKDAYLKEKHAFSDFLTGLKGFEDISQFMALDSVKHKASSLALENGLMNLKNADKLNADVLKVLLGEDADAFLSFGKANFSNVDAVKLEALKKYDEEAYNLFTNVERIDGVGHKGYSHVVQVRDDSAGTFSGRYTDANIESGLVDDFKGAKYSKHMNTNLRRAIYDNDSLSLTRKRLSALGLEDEFTGTFGHALDSSGAIKTSMKGKSILDPIAERLDGLLAVGPGETLLSDETGDRYNYLKKLYGKNADKISSKRAELIYSEYMGRKAINFNNMDGFNRSAYNKLVNNDIEEYRFQELDLTKARPGVADDWMSLDFGGQGDTVTSAKNNPYTNNLMIRYGKGQNDLLAINRMPELHFEDNVIKTAYISKLKGFQDLIQQVNKGEGTTQDIAKWENQIKSTAVEIKNLQKQAITSKTGLTGQALEVRADQSFFGKASGIVYNDNETIEDIMTKSAADKAARINRIMEDNPLFNKAFFQGKSLAQHYGEGKVLDNVFLSKESFKNMGYFDQDFMEDIFSKMDSSFDEESFSKYIGSTDKKTLEEGMEKLLEKHGDSFISVRYPEIMEGSDKVLMGYLNKDLRGNQMQATGHTGMSMKMDHDGDMGAVIRAKTAKDESMINYLTQGSKSSADLTNLGQATESIMMKRSVNENWYWDSKVKGKLGKEAEVAYLEKMKDGKTMLDIIAGEKMIDGELISSMIDPSNISTREYEGLLKKYENELKTTANYASNKKFDGNIHDESLKAIKASENMNVKEYANAYAYQLYKDENVSKSAGKAIGEINVTNQKINTAMVNLLDRTSDDYNYISSISKDLFHIAEEQAISAKSSIEGLDPDRAKKWNEDVIRLVTGGVSDDEVLQIKGRLNNFAEKYMAKDIDLNQYWNASSFFQDKINSNFGTSLEDMMDFDIFLKSGDNKAKVTSMVINDFTNKIADLRDVDNIGKIFDQMSFGQSTAGVSKGIMEAISIDGVPSNSEQLIKLREMLIATEEDMRKITVSQKLNSERIMSSASGEIIDSVERNSSKKSMSHAILEGAGDLFKGVKSSNIAMTAVGLAAGVMAAGFVGGRPRPADVQAMEEAQDYAPMEGYTPLADPGLAFQRGGSSGYVVNINARTNKGRDQAVSAIQQALASGTSSNINVSMNINDNYGNMNDRDLERAIEDVFR